MNHRIDIDDDVYAVLEKHVRGFEQPNDVLRRLLLADVDEKSARPSRWASPTTTRPGRLASLLASGLIKPGDELRHEQVRKGRQFTAAVEADGWIKTPEGRHSSPSPALGKLVGTQIDGWQNWLHVPSGKTLRQLRQMDEGNCSDPLPKPVPASPGAART